MNLSPAGWHKAVTASVLFPWCVYMLENADKTRLYTGITNDLTARIKVHNAGKGAKATRAKRPWSLVWRFRCTSKREALRVEWRVKRLTRKQKLEMMKESFGLLTELP
jgi:putative endonuclease